MLDRPPSSIGDQNHKLFFESCIRMLSWDVQSKEEKRMHSIDAKLYLWKLVNFVFPIRIQITDCYGWKYSFFEFQLNRLAFTFLWNLPHTEPRQGSWRISWTALLSARRVPRRQPTSLSPRTKSKISWPILKRMGFHEWLSIAGRIL